VTEKPDGKRWKGSRRMALCVAAVPLVYVSAYFILGTHTTGETFVMGRPRTGVYTYHDRGFPFDPWIFRPLAQLEYRLRGEHSQVVIEDGRYRGGQPLYSFGPFE